MKRDTFYLIVAVVIFLMGSSFYLGYRIGNPGEINPEDMVKIKRERDSLEFAFKASEQREALLLQQAKADSLAIVKADSKVAEIEKKRVSDRRKFSQQIAELEHAQAPELDSFFTERYPEDKYKPKFNADTGVVALPEWRARAIAQDKIRLDAAIQESTNLISKINVMQEQIDTRDRFIKTQEELLAEKSSQLENSQAQTETHRQESEVLKKQVKKVKRERNVAILGAVAGVALAIFGSK